MPVGEWSKRTVRLCGKCSGHIDESCWLHTRIEREKLCDALVPALMALDSGRRQEAFDDAEPIRRENTAIEGKPWWWRSAYIRRTPRLSVPKTALLALNRMT